MSVDKAIFIVGPTASGKTDLAVKIAHYFNGEIISADSRQVYVGLDLGTGKEGEEKISNFQFPISNQNRLAFIKQRARYIKNIPQYLIDIVEPGGEMYNLSFFLEDAKLLMADIWSRGKLPIVVGGTGLYVTALLKGYKLPKKKRGRGEWRVKEPSDFNALVIGIETDRFKLYKAIDCRLDKRIELGMIDEVKKLLDSGVSPDWLERLGLEYRYTKRYLMKETPHLNPPLGKGRLGGVTIKDYRDELRFAIHAYARRQLTWLRHQIDRVEWVTTSAQAANLTVKFLKNKS